MDHVVVVGNSGSGKTTLARLLATAMAADHVELDALFHQPGWTERPADEFRGDIESRLKGPRWVVDGNYNTLTRDLTWPRADTIVVFDFPRHVVMRRVLIRTIRRSLTREELWNGNREPLGNFFRWHPQENIIRWTWTQHEKYRRQYREAAADPRWAALDFVWLRKHDDPAALLARAA